MHNTQETSQEISPTDHHTEEETDWEAPSVQVPQPSSSWKRIYFILIFVLALVAVLSLVDWGSKTDIDLAAKISGEEERQQAKTKQIEQVIKMQEMYETVANNFTLSSKVKQRISYGEPRPKPHNIKAKIINKKGTNSGDCIFTNGVSVISSKTISTGNAFLQQQKAYKWILILPRVDSNADKLLKQFSDVTVQDIDIDSDYNFITQFTSSCSSIVYLQNNFIVDSVEASKVLSQSQKLKQNYVNGYMGFTTKSQNFKNIQRKHEDLRTTDLQKLKDQSFNQYIYIFDSKFLQIITPLNFVHFNKYTIEQMFINPILAIVQHSQFLVPVENITYSFDEAIVQFKQFELVPRIKRGQYCLVNYPSNPSVNSLEEFKEYLSSALTSKNIIIVSYFSYNFNNNTLSLRQFYKLLDEVRTKNPNIKIRMKIKQFKAVSSLAVYESAHVYCDRSAFILSSRHNIKFTINFIQSLQSSVQQNFHYYLPSATSFNIKEYLKQNRFNQRLFSQQLSNLQIFRTEYLKMLNLWAFKSNDTAFCESQACFIVPLLEILGHQIKTIASFYKTLPKSASKTEEQQLKNLNKYGRWSKANNLAPIQYNSLTMVNLRKGYLNQIPKIIHQVWLQEQPIPSHIQKLQDSIKKANPEYKYMLWGLKNLTYPLFSMSYSTIARILDHQWATGKDYHAWVQAVFSYEVLYNNGGFYLDLSAQGIRPLDDFLKYPLFFGGYRSEPSSYSNPTSVDRRIIGVKQNSYHLRMVLTEILTPARINCDLNDYESILGGLALRSSLLNSQIFTNVGFGFHLTGFDQQSQENSCKGTVPCGKFEDAYVVFHNVTA